MISRRPPAPSLFVSEQPTTSSASSSGWITAHCDGGARGNPGPSGYGAEITGVDGGVLAELSEFLGIRTNNYAEYSGLLASLEYALAHGHGQLRVVSDSELMVKQIQGKYKVNSPDLKPLWQEAKNRIARLDRFEITHALRHKNKAADRLANEAMDRGMRPNTPAEGKPLVRSGEGAVRAGSGVERLPLRAIPYPAKNAAPPAPAVLDPEARRGVSQSDPPVLAPAAATSTSTSSTSTSSETPAMLRGFARGGVIHILGAHSLPDGRFVKIIPE